MVAVVAHASECIIMFLIIDFSIEYGYIRLSLACPRLQDCALKIIRPNYTLKAIRPKPYAQNHTPKTIPLKPYPQKPYAQSQTICPNPYAQNHTPKTIHPKPYPQKPYAQSQTICPNPYAQNHTPKRVT